MRYPEPRSDLPPIFEGMPSLKVFVVGAVRNVEKSIASTVTDIKRFCGGVDVHEWFFVESDSTDNTLSVLEDFSRHISGFRFHSLGNLIGSTPNRVIRIAEARQFALEGIRQKISSDDVVIVVDCDGVTRSLVRDDLIRVIGLLSEYSVVTANTKGIYYDILALRAQGWVEEDYRITRRRLISSGKSFASAHFESLVVKQRKIRGSQPLEVDSAFSGIALYSGSAFILSNYRVKAELECEHVHFHRSLRSLGYKICIDPLLRVTSEAKHTLLASDVLKPVWAIFTRLPKSFLDFIFKPVLARIEK